MFWLLTSFSSSQHTLPAGDPGWFLNAFFGSEAGNNMGCFEDPILDGMLESLSTIEDPETRVEASNALQARLREEVPISNLVTPDWHIGLSDRVRDYQVSPSPLSLFFFC